MSSSSKPIKILHLTTHLNVGGITSYILMLGRAMQGRGHDVRVVSAGGVREADFTGSGLQSYRFEIRTKSVLSPKLFLALPRMIRLVKKEGIQILHAHTRVAQALGTFVSACTGIPLVTTAHGFFRVNLGRRLFPFWGKRTIAISDGVAQDLQVSHKVPAEKIRTVENAIDTKDSQKRLAAKDRLEIRKRYGIPESATALCCISRMVGDKGQDFLLKATASLIPVFPELYLILVGDGRERENLISLSKSLNISKRVIFITEAVDVTEPLAACDIFVHPATYREGFGLVIAEAMFAKKPVILTRIPALDTLFYDRKDCLMVPPSDATALTIAIKALLRDPIEAKRLSEAGYARASQFWTVDRWSAGIERVYEEVLNP